MKKPAIHTTRLNVLTRRIVLYASVFCCPLASVAQNLADTPELIKPTPVALRTTLETWKLPGTERMGVIGGTALFDVSDPFKLGLGTYGAVRGDRGGFITLGAAGEYQLRISPSVVGHAGLFVGAGGGRGATSTGTTLSGGGLMLRSDLGLTYQSKDYGNLGFGISHVSFPSGLIRSTQPYLLYEYPFYSLLERGWNSHKNINSTQTIATNAQEFSAVARSYRVPAGVLGDDGKAQAPRIQLLGVEWLSYLDQNWFLKLETDGAAGGQNAGYMQILAGGGYKLPVTKSMAVKLHAAAGPAGGGNVDSGGGLLLDAGLSLQQKITNNTALELSVGKVAAPSRSFKATSVGVKLTHQFGTPSVNASTVSRDALSAFEATPLRVRFASQTYLKGSPNWRSNYTDLSVSNLGAQLDYFYSPHLFLTGQGLAAYSGKAGAYMTGQIGVGGQIPISQNLFIEAEALLGAAGGGGLAVGGGLVRQVNASAGYRLSKSLSIMATAGQVAALGGNFKANVAGVSLGYQFTGFSSP